MALIAHFLTWGTKILIPKGQNFILTYILLLTINLSYVKKKTQRWSTAEGLKSPSPNSLTEPSHLKPTAKAILWKRSTIHITSDARLASQWCGTDQRPLPNTNICRTKFVIWKFVTLHPLLLIFIHILHGTVSKIIKKKSIENQLQSIFNHS